LHWIEGLLDFLTRSVRAESCDYLHLPQTVLEVFTITGKSSKLIACPSRGLYIGDILNRWGMFRL
jgi:hypothetical protein